MTKTTKDKIILDACCGGRCFWENKQHPNTLYIDIREAPKGTCPERPEWNCSPDMIADFRDLPFENNTFKLIVWDPPHITQKDGQKNLRGILVKKYGALHAETWPSDLKKGFNELWRVLDDYGTLVFKFHDNSIDFERVLKLFHTRPLFGTTTRKRKFGETRYFVFMKIPK